MKMHFVVWGAGERGQRIFPHIKDNIEAFIDLNSQKQGSMVCMRPVINYEQYKQDYSYCYILISISHEDEVVEFLQKENNNKYFRMSDCPGEFQEPWSRDNLKKYIFEYAKTGKKYGIYGLNLYALVLNDWIKNKTGEEAVLIPALDMQEDLYNQIKEDFPEYSYDQLSKQSNLDEVLVTIEEDMSVLEKREYGIPYKNVYDCSNYITEYYNADLDKFKNIHKGKRCFIVATGPSLTMDDLNTLWSNSEICISMNSIWKAFENTDWRPQYYVADDYRVMDDEGFNLIAGDLNCLFLGDTNGTFWSVDHSDNIHIHHLVYEYSESRLPKFSEDFSRKCYMGSTVTYSCIQLAVYMGFTEIYLLGVDYSYAGETGKRYEHFYNETTLTSISWDRQVSLAYKSAKDYTDKHEVTIYNATRGGKLEVFERVDFDCLFSK